jgi:hypothetical protein
MDGQLLAIDFHRSTFRLTYVSVARLCCHQLSFVQSIPVLFDRLLQLNVAFFVPVQFILQFSLHAAIVLSTCPFTCRFLLDSLGVFVSPFGPAQGLVPRLRFYCTFQRSLKKTRSSASLAKQDDLPVLAASSLSWRFARSSFVSFDAGAGFFFVLVRHRTEHSEERPCGLSLRLQLQRRSLNQMLDDLIV